MTRACSLPLDLARRARHPAVDVGAVGVALGRAQTDVIDDVLAVAPLDVDHPAQHQARAGGRRSELEGRAPLDEARADADALPARIASRAERAPGQLGGVEPLQVDARPLLGRALLTRD